MTGPAERGCEFCDRCPQAAEACVHAPYAMRQVGDGHFVSCCGGKEAMP